MLAVARSRFVDVDGIRTHYWDAGDGPVVVLLHAGEFGGSAELTWERTVPALTERYRVIAPDWLGFGQTDKIHDFGGGQRLRLAHMTRFLATMAIDDAVFVGSSMGASLLAQVAASGAPSWPIRALVLVSGGGFIPFNEARRRMLDYDGTPGGMEQILAVLFHDPAFARDAAYVERRHRASIQRGAWEAVAAARLRRPTVEPASDFGRPDPIEYEGIAVPTLLVAGADDPLREPGYVHEIERRIADVRTHVQAECGHMPQLEHPEDFNRLLLDFLATQHAEPEWRS